MKFHYAKTSVWPKDVTIRDCITVYREHGWICNTIDQDAWEEFEEAVKTGVVPERLDDY